MIHYQLKDYQICVDYIEKATEIGLNSRFEEEAHYIRECKDFGIKL